MYALQFIMHSWGDEQCVEILKNARAAVKPGGCIVIMDTVCGSGLMHVPRQAALPSTCLHLGMMACTGS
jgi:hypothetical protein